MSICIWRALSSRAPSFIQQILSQIRSLSHLSNINSIRSSKESSQYGSGLGSASIFFVNRRSFAKGKKSKKDDGDTVQAIPDTRHVKLTTLSQMDEAMTTLSRGLTKLRIGRASPENDDDCGTIQAVPGTGHVRLAAHSQIVEAVTTLSRELIKLQTDRALPENETIDRMDGRIPRQITSEISFIIRSFRVVDLHEFNRSIHAQVVKHGLESENAITTSMIGFYSSINELDNAKKLFNSSPNKDLILWGSIVTALCKNGHYVEAIHTFSKMKYSNISPNIISLLCVLTACANAKNLLCGKQIHGFSITKGFVFETSLETSLLDMYMKCGELDCAMSVFDEITNKNIVAWRNAILGLIENGSSEKAVNLFCRMRASDTEIDEAIVRNVIRVCSQIDESSFGISLHAYVVKNGLLNFITIGTPLLKMYAEFKDVDTAQSLFSTLKFKDDRAWNAMISVYSNSCNPIYAFDLFNEMKTMNVDANEYTFVSLLQACSSIESHRLGRSVHAHTLRLGYITDMIISSALIDFYCKTGRLNQGEAMFHNLKTKDLICWSSMINGYGIHGLGNKSIDTYNTMLNNGLLPNEVVLVSVLSSCSHSSLLEEGMNIFNSMKGKFGISPNMAHYSCVIDLLSRRGDVNRAMELVEGMPFKPDASILVSLIGWCRNRKDDAEIMEFLEKQLSRLDANDTDYFVTLANMYSKLGKWEESERVRELMEQNGLRKIAGHSVI